MERGTPERTRKGKINWCKARVEEGVSNEREGKRVFRAPEQRRNGAFREEEQLGGPSLGREENWARENGGES